MRKPLLLAGLCLLLLLNNELSAQANLNWASSFFPGWNNGNTNGNAPNVGGLGINSSANASIVGNGAFMQANGNSGAQTPTVQGATLVVPGSASRLQVTPNFNNLSSYSNIVINFTAPANNVSFRIADIDKVNPGNNSYYDRVTVTGSNGVTTYNATLTKYDAITDPNFLQISGNVAHVNTSPGQAGNAGSNATDQRGTVNVSFGATAITSITIRIDNAPGANSNPGTQTIVVGEITFTPIPLPVVLTSFNAIRSGNDVKLSWITLQESNSANFEIERSTGNNWNKIGTLAAAGNSSDTRNYQFNDLQVPSDFLLYRLKQIDIDGNFKYSSIVRVSSKNEGNRLLAFPNPFTSTLSINVSAGSAGPAQLSLYDMLGKLVRRETTILNAGSNSISIGDPLKLLPGLYQLELRTTQGELIGRTQLIKQ